MLQKADLLCLLLLLGRTHLYGLLPFKLHIPATSLQLQLLTPLELIAFFIVLAVQVGPGGSNLGRTFFGQPGQGLVWGFRSAPLVLQKLTHFLELLPLVLHQNLVVVRVTQAIQVPVFEDTHGQLEELEHKVEAFSSKAAIKHLLQVHLELLLPLLFLFGGELSLKDGKRSEKPRHGRQLLKLAFGQLAGALL